LLALIGSVVWSGGCSSDNSRAYCDSTGCYTCDGYGCTPTGGSDASAGTDGGVPVSDAGVPTDAGTWQPPPPACKYPSDCPDGKSCVNGQCVPTCTDPSQCSPGNTCVKGVCQPGPPQCTADKDCPAATPKCAGGRCVSVCTKDSECPTGDYCYQGACIPDTRGTQNCSATDTSKCNASQKCVDGFCKYTCSSDTTCEHIDERIAFCGVDKVCRTQAEAHPQCTSSTTCASGQLCVNNVCE